MGKSDKIVTLNANTNEIKQTLWPNWTKIVTLNANTKENCHLKHI